MSLRMVRWRVLCAAAAALAIGIPGCGSGGGSSSAAARYFNALIGVAGNQVDFLSSQGGTSSVRASQVGFGTISPAVGTLPLPVGSGNETFQVVASGTTAPSLASLAATVAGGARYVVAASGIVGQTNAAAPRLLISTDSIPGIGGSQAALRVIPLAPDAPNIDIVNTPPNGQPTPIVGLTNLPYATFSNYVLVPSGNYNLSVRVAGTGTVLPTASNTSLLGLVNGKAYTIVTFGLVHPGTGQPAFDLRLVADN
jgi:hypothetical protein